MIDHIDTQGLIWQVIMVNRTYSTDTQRVRQLTFKSVLSPTIQMMSCTLLTLTYDISLGAAVGNQNSGSRQKENVTCHLQWRQYSQPTFPECNQSLCLWHISRLNSLLPPCFVSVNSRFTPVSDSYERQCFITTHILDLTMQPALAEWVWAM